MERSADFEVISRDPDLFFRLNPRQVALDEAQVHPPVFSALRVAIDEHRRGGAVCYNGVQLSRARS
ncbi:MAG: hypothetical protein IPP35_12540 [Elusimicrobia bacterium]|nr:hypothetical protein [Elusimicrobiota bacterium]